MTDTSSLPTREIDCRSRDTQGAQRCIISFDEAEARELHRLARERNTSVEELIRAAIKKALSPR